MQKQPSGEQPPRAREDARRSRASCCGCRGRGRPRCAATSSSSPSAPRHGLELEALGAEELVRARVDVLEQEDLDLVLGERGVRVAGHGRVI